MVLLRPKLSEDPWRLANIPHFLTGRKPLSMWLGNLVCHLLSTSDSLLYTSSDQHSKDTLSPTLLIGLCFVEVDNQSLAISH